MTEAIWGEAAKTPEINWRMSASLENVPRGTTDVAEVTNLERAVRDWLALDPQHEARRCPNSASAALRRHLRAANTTAALDSLAHRHQVSVAPDQPA